MIITKVEQMSKTRSKIYIDEVFAFVLYKGELHLYGITEGEEIAQSNYEKIMEEVLPKRARQRSIHLLKSREYTTKQLKDKLTEGGYPEDIVRQTVGEMVELKYVDDIRYADQFIRCQCQYKSRKRIEQDLWKKGISSDIVNQIYAEWEELGVANQREVIRELLQKKRYYDREWEYEEKQKLMAWLYRKGFSMDDIMSEM